MLDLVVTGHRVSSFGVVQQGRIPEKELRLYFYITFIIPTLLCNCKSKLVFKKNNIIPLINI